MDTVEAESKGKKAYTYSEYTLDSKLSEAYSACSNGYGQPIQRQILAVEHAKNEVQKFLDKSQLIIDERWKAYKDAAGSIEIDRYESIGE